MIGLLALASAVVYFGTDVIEMLQGGFSTGQLWLTLVAEATIPVSILGLWLVQRPRIGRLGGLSAIAYGYSFVFFTCRQEASFQPPLTHGRVRVGHWDQGLPTAR